MSLLPSSPTSDEQDRYPYGPQPPTFPATPGNSEDATWVSRTPFLLIALASLGAIADFFAMPSFGLCEWLFGYDSDAVGASIVFSAAAIFSQVGALCSVFVLVQRHFFARVGVCWSLAICWWCCWAAGMLVYYRVRLGDRFDQDTECFEILRFTALSIPLLALAIQLPLWFVRLYLRWRLVASARPESPERQLSIKDYFLGTAIVGVSITIARFATPANRMNSEYWSRWVVVGVIVLAISFCVILPAVHLMFCKSRHGLLSLAVLICYGLFLAFVAIGIVAMVEPPADFSWAALKPLVAFTGAFVLTMLFFGLELLAIRQAGFDLARGNGPSLLHHR